jgi:two-component system, OmpR family, response regulator VanR
VRAAPYVLLVEDEENVAYVVALALRHASFEVRVVDTGTEALRLSSASPPPDIVVLDVMLPDLDGFEVCRRMRADQNDLPVLFLTARDAPADRLHGLTIGADDYLTKPFELQELVLRLRALDRRRAHARPPVRELAGLRLDPFRREVYRGDRYIALTRKQFAVLDVLVAAEGGVVSAEELLAQAWDENADPFTNAVRITISALRKRLGPPWIITTVPGAGYRIDTETDGRGEGQHHG